MTPTSKRHKGENSFFLFCCCRWGRKAKEHNAFALLTPYDRNSVLVQEGATPSLNCTMSTVRDLRATDARLCSDRNDALSETSAVFASVLPLESNTRAVLLPQSQIFLWFTACVYSWLVYSHLFSCQCCPLASIALL